MEAALRRGSASHDVLANVEHLSNDIDTFIKSKMHLCIFSNVSTMMPMSNHIVPVKLLCTCINIDR